MNHGNGGVERCSPDEPPASGRPSGVSRRRFLRTSGLGVAGGALPVTFATADIRTEAVADVVVVGTGAAGLSAAVTAHDLGARVRIVEKAPFVGGTTIKSGGVFWVPNNSKMRDADLIDERDMALRLMARLAYPTLYDPTDAELGLPTNEFALIAAFYDNGAEPIDSLETAGALRPLLYRDFAGEPFPDYFATLPENAAPRGRALQPEDDAGNPLFLDRQLVGQLATAVSEREISVLLDTSVTSLISTPNTDVKGAPRCRMRVSPDTSPRIRLPDA